MNGLLVVGIRLQEVDGKYIPESTKLSDWFFFLLIL